MIFKRRNFKIISNNQTTQPTMSIELGLCCINTELRDRKPKRTQVFCSRTCTRSTFTVDKAKKLSEQNLRDLIPMIEWNAQHRISVMRLTSDFFPHYTDSATEKYNLDFSIPIFTELCQTLSKLQPHRFTMHPGQYCCLGSTSKNVIEKTFDDLKMHAFVLDQLSSVAVCDVINIHGGGVYGDKESALRRWYENFDDLPRTVKDKLTVENDEKSYNIDDCLEIAAQCKIPVCFDIFHHLCYEQSHGNPSYTYNNDIDLDVVIQDCTETWSQNKTPLFHISEQRPDSRLGTHADFVESIPIQLLHYHNFRDIDIDVEAKLKEQAIIKLYNKYPKIF